MQIFALILLALASIPEAKSEAFTISNWSHTCKDNCLSIETARLFINEREDGLFRIDYTDSKYPQIYIFLRQGDSLALSVDTTLKKIIYQTNLQSLADLSDLTTGYQHLVDVFKLLRSETPEDFSTLADSMISLRLEMLKKLQQAPGSGVPQEWWDAEYCNIITFPLNALNAFWDSPEFLGYGTSILEKIPGLPQNLLSRPLLGNADSYISNHLYEHKQLTVAHQPQYYEAMSQYLKGEVLEYVLAQRAMSEFDYLSTPEEIDELFNFVASKVSDAYILGRLKAARDDSKQRRISFMQQQVALFHNSIDQNGESFANHFLQDKETFIMISSSGCAPCTKASKWMAEHYEAVKDKANIYTIAIGSIDRFKKEQEKNPYPWPVFYDESGEIRSQLPRPSVPQYFLVKDGQLIHTDAPEPQAYFGNLVVDPR